MPLKFTQRPESEVLRPGRPGRVNEDLVALQKAMSTLAKDMVLEIEAGSQRAVRGAKTLVTRAAKQLGTPWRHWSVGSTVYAEPARPVRRRRGPKPSATAAGRRPRSTTRRAR